jgi:monoamine oxidase
MVNRLISRRTVVKTAGAAALSTVVPNGLRAQTKQQVIVIGAGLSGLHTALLLEEEGFDVQVIEGRTRAGGRLKTLDDVPGRPEAGGTGFGAGYARLIDAADRYGVEIWDWHDRTANMRARELVIDDQIVTPQQWPDHPQNPLPAAYKEEMPWTYWYRFMGRHVPFASSGDWRNPEFAHLDIAFDDWMLNQGASSAAIDMACNHKWEYNNSTHDVSALTVMFEYMWGRQMYQKDNQPSFMVIKGGNQRLPEAMAELLRKEVHYGKEVIGMRTGIDNAEVHCADGTVYRADRVVCSIPLPVLRRIKVDPYFTGVQRKAIWTVPRQLVTQVHIVPTAPFWKEDGHLPGMYITNSPVGFTLPNYGQEDPDELTSLTAWMMGNKAERMDQMDQDSATALVISTIEKIRPAAKGKLEVAGYKSWFRDPFSSGDWVNFGPGQVTRFAGKMNAPHGRIHICGDATAVTSRGMEAALESAERAAIEILTTS